jgi:hypothetical protein
MKIFTLLFAFALALAAQSLTPVADTIKDGANQGVTGSCTYRLASGRAVGAVDQQLVGEPVTVRFTNGAFSAAIVPTDTATPATQYYTVSCSGSRGWSQQGYWIVPTSGTALKLKDLWVALPPSPPATFLPSQIRQAGAGTWCLTSIDGVVAWRQPCGSSGTLTWGNATGTWGTVTGTWGGN